MHLKKTKSNLKIIILTTCGFFIILTIIFIRNFLQNGSILTFGSPLNTRIYAYTDTSNLRHLIKYGKEILKGDYLYVKYYPNGTYIYYDNKTLEEGRRGHLMKDGKEILSGKFLNPTIGNSCFLYLDEKRNKHIIDETGKEIATLNESGIFMQENCDYSYSDKNDLVHLMRRGKEIAVGSEVKSFLNNDYYYTDKKTSIGYIFHNGKITELGKNIDSVYVNSDNSVSYTKNNEYHLVKDGVDTINLVKTFNNGDILNYNTTDKKLHLFRNNNEIASGISVESYDNGYYMFQDQIEGSFYLMKDGTEIARAGEIILYPNSDYVLSSNIYTKKGKLFINNKLMLTGNDIQEFFETK